MIAKILCLIVVLIHVYIVLLEMVFWKKRAARVFRMPQALVEQTASMASNQGLYNLFLVVALLLGLCLSDPRLSSAFTAYALGCVGVAGIWGALTVSPRIAVVQTVPALLALIAGYFGI
jgi:putative membrane protein